MISLQNFDGTPYRGGPPARKPDTGPISGPKGPGCRLGPLVDRRPGFRDKNHLGVKVMALLINLERRLVRNPLNPSTRPLYKARLGLDRRASDQ